MMFSFNTLVGTSMNGLYFESLFMHTSSSALFIATSRATGMKFAVKALRKMFMSAKQRQYLMHELRMNRLLRRSLKLNEPCENITLFHRWFETDDALYLVFEFVEGGDLFDQLASHELTDVQKRQILLGVVNAVQYLHSVGIYHRDIKPENILLTPSLTPKLADFGLACTLATSQEYEIGTLAYMAPEVYNESDAPIGYSPEKADIWSLGVLMYTIATETKIYWTKPTGEHLITGRLLKEKLMDDGLALPLVEVIMKCLDSDPEKRPSLEQITDQLRQLPTLMQLSFEPLLTTEDEEEHLPADAATDDAESDKTATDYDDDGEHSIRTGTKHLSLGLAERWSLSRNTFRSSLII